MAADFWVASVSANSGRMDNSVKGRRVEVSEEGGDSGKRQCGSRELSQQRQ